MAEYHIGHSPLIADDEGKPEFGYEWDLKDGRRVQLLVKILPKEDSDAEIH